MFLAAGMWLPPVPILIQQQEEIPSGQPENSQQQWQQQQHDAATRQIPDIVQLITCEYILKQKKVRFSI